MDKKNKVKNSTIQRKTLLLLIFLSTIFMSIGYATINSISLNINGLAQAKVQENIFISNTEYNNSLEAEDSKVISTYQTMLNSSVNLSKTNEKSYVTFSVQVYNNSDYYYLFKEVVYDDEFYNNSNITYKLENLSKGDRVNSHDNLEFKITFSYLNNQLPDTSISDFNILNSYINFVFIPEYELKEYNITNHILVKNSLTTSPFSLENVGASYIANETNPNYSIDTTKGLHIYDIETATGYWLYYAFVEDDGYTSALNINNTYYARCENKLLSIDTTDPNSHFSIFLSNAYHESGKWGFYDAEGINNTVTNDYRVISMYQEKLQQYGDDEYGYGYIDTLQFGSSMISITDSYTKNLMLIDLTSIFGTNNEPPQKYCDENIAYDTQTVLWF